MKSLFYDKFDSKYKYWNCVITNEKYLKYSYINNKLLQYLFTNENYGIEKIINLDVETDFNPNAQANNLKLFIITMQIRISPSIIAMMAMYRSQFSSEVVVTPETMEKIIENKNYDLMLLLSMLKIEFFDEKIRIKHENGETETKNKDDKDIKEDFIVLLSRYLIIFLDYNNKYNEQKQSKTALRQAAILLHTIYLDKLDEGLERDGLEFNLLIEEAINNIVVATDGQKIGKYDGRLYVAKDKLKLVRDGLSKIIFENWQRYYEEIRGQEITENDIYDFFKPIEQHIIKNELIKEIKSEVVKSIDKDDPCAQKIKMLIAEYKAQHNHPGWLTVLDSTINKGMLEMFGVTLNYRLNKEQYNQNKIQKITNKAEKKIKQLTEPLWLPWDVAWAFGCYMHRSLIDVNYNSIKELPTRIHEDNVFLFQSLQECVKKSCYTVPTIIALLATSSVYFSPVISIPLMYTATIIITDFYREEPYIKPAMEQLSQDVSFVSRILAEKATQVAQCVGLAK